MAFDKWTLIELETIETIQVFATRGLLSRDAIRGGEIVTRLVYLRAYLL